MALWGAVRTTLLADAREAETQAMIDLRVNVKRRPSGSSVNLAINQVRRPMDTLDG